MDQKIFTGFKCNYKLPFILFQFYNYFDVLKRFNDQKYAFFSWMKSTFSNLKKILDKKCEMESKTTLSDVENVIRLSKECEYTI